MTKKSALYRYALLLTAALAACFLLILSWPRLHASVNYLPVDTAISNYWKTREIDSAQLDGLIAKARESIAIHDHYRYLAGLSELQILVGQDRSRSFQQRRKALEDVIEAASKVVKKSPAKPRPWLRMARAREVLGYPAEQFIPDLKMSVLTGRVEPTLMIARLELGLRHLSALDDEGFRLIRDQALLTWATQRRAMVKGIKSGTIGAAPLRNLLAANYPDALAEMEIHFDQ